MQHRHVRHAGYEANDARENVGHETRRARNLAGSIKRYSNTNLIEIQCDG